MSAAAHAASYPQVLRGYLSTGFWAIDCWEGDPRVDHGQTINDADRLCQCWYVRPAEVHKKGKLIDRSWGGTCILWSNDRGCILKFENRPFQCRMLKPNVNREKERGCIFPKGSDKEAVMLLWVPYQGLMDQVIDRMKV